MAGNMIKLRATITLALLICSTAWATESARIDRTFTAKGDLKGTGSQQLLTLRVQGTSINAPFIWSVSIYDRGGALIYHYKSDDALIDKFFHDPGFESDCAGYQSCKERYYFLDLPAEVFSGIRPSKAGFFADKFDLTDFRRTASRYLMKMGLSRHRISMAIEEMQNILQRPGYHTLVMPISPVMDSVPMIWVPSVNAFIPYYED